MKGLTRLNFGEWRPARGGERVVVLSLIPALDDVWSTEKSPVMTFWTLHGQ